MSFGKFTQKEILDLVSASWSSYWGTGGGGGGGTPGGPSTSIQFNDAGAFSGSSDFTFNKDTDTVNLTGSLNIISGGVAFTVSSSNVGPIAQFLGSGNGSYIQFYNPAVGGLQAGLLIYPYNNGVADVVGSQLPLRIYGSSNTVTLETNTSAYPIYIKPGSGTTGGNVFLSGSLYVTKSLYLPGLESSSVQTKIVTFDSSTGQVFYITSSLLSASYALTASVATSATSLPPGTYNITASWANNALTASWITSSNVYGPYGSNSILSSSYAITASYALNGAGGDSIWVRSSGDNSAVLDDLSGRISSAQGSSSIAYGYINTASGDFSQAQGYNTIAIGESAHSEGANTIARGATSHVEGFDNIAGSNISRKNYHINDIQYSTIPSGSGTLYYDAVNLLGTLTFVLAVDDPNSSLHNLVFMPVFWSGSVSGSGGVNTNIYASQSLAIYDGTTRQLVKHVDLSSWYDPVLTKASLSGSDAYQQNITYMWHNPIQDRVYVMFTNFNANGVGYGAEKGVFWLSGSYDGINPPDIYIHNTSSFSDGWHNVYFWTGSVATETAWTGSAPSEQYLNGVLREYPPWPVYLGIHPILENQPTFNKINGKHYVQGNRFGVSGGNQPLSGIAIINSDFQLEYTGSIPAVGITNNTIVDFAIQGQYPLGKGFRTPISGCAFPGYQSGYFNNKGAVDSRGNVWFGTRRKTAGNPVDLICLYATGSVSSSNDQLFKHTINYLNEGTCSRHIAGPIYYPGDGTPNSERIIVVAAFTGSQTYNSINFPGTIDYQNGLSNAHMRWLAYDIDGNLKENPWNQFKWGKVDVNLSDQGEALYNRYTFEASVGGDIDGNTVYWWEKEKAFVTRFSYYRPLPDGQVEQPRNTLVLINAQGAVIDGLRYEKVVDNVNSVFVDNNFPNGPILRLPWGGANGFYTPTVHNIGITNNGESLVLQLGHYIFGGSSYPGYTKFYTQSFVWVDPVITPYTSSGAGSYEFGQYAHAEGITTTARGYGSHTEGHYTVTSGAFSHAEGFQSRAKGESSHAEGWYTLSSGSYSHAEGLETTAQGDGSHAEGYFTFAKGRGSHAEGAQYVTATGDYSHAEGGYTTAAGLGSHAEGLTSYAIGNYSHAEGQNTYANVLYSHAEGAFSVADGQSSHAEGFNARAVGAYSHAEGESTSYSLYYAQGRASHVEGYNTKTLTAGAYGHAEGELTTVSGRGAHAEGINTTAAASHSHAEGSGTTTNGLYSHAEGSSSIAYGTASHAAGLHTLARGDFQSTIGKYNLDNNFTSLFVIGDGTDNSNRHDLLNAGVGFINITGSNNISGSWNLIGPGSITGSLIVSNSFSVIGNTNFVGNTNFSGSVTISSSLNIIGTSTVTGSSIISGSQTIIGTEQITGSLIVSNSLNVIGTNTTSGSVYITGSSTLIGNQTITGSILMTGSAAISSINYIDFVTTANPTHTEGRVHWLDDTKTLQVDTEVSNFNIELGHQSIVRVYNPNSYTMTPGMVVFISGSQGNRPSITTASWEGDPSSAGTIGFVATTIGSSGNGYVVTNGLLRNVNTNAFNVGDRLFLSSSGQFTNTPPDAPLHEVRLGNVIVQNATTGVIYVGIMNGYELTELHDVKTTTYTNGDLLIQSNSLWINSKQLTGSYELTGSLSFTNGGVTGSLYGTASWSTNALTASYVNTLYQDVIVVGNITAQQYIVSSSVLYITQSNYSGSTIFGNSLDDTHQFTGSIYYTGSITGIGRAIFNDLSATGSLSGSFFGIASGSILNGISFWGTSSWAASASVAISSSYALSSSYAESASYAISSSWTQPGGPYTSIQFNDSNVLSGSSNFTFDKNTNTVNLTGSLYVTGSTAISGTLDIISNVATQLQPAVKVNTSGVLSFGSQSLEPTVVVGGIYFDGNDFYLGFP